MRHDQHDHEPDPTFVDHLEWQIDTALRRRGRFARPVPSGAVRAVRTLLIVLVSLVGGAGAVVAAERLQDARERDLALARTRLELELAEARFALVANEHRRLEALVADGLVGQREARGSRTQLADAEREVRRLRLDREEIALSGQPPRHVLSAPLVAGRDFVSERLELEREAAQLHYGDVEVELRDRRQLVEAGVVGEDELRGAESALAQVEGHVRLLLERMKLRRAFLAGTLTAEEVELHARRLELELELRVVQVEQVRLADSLRRTQELEEAGMVSAGEGDRARLELRTLEGQLELLRLELAFVAERLGETPTERGQGTRERRR